MNILVALGVLLLFTAVVSSKIVSEKEKQNIVGLTNRWWKCSTEHGQLRITQSRSALYLGRFFKIAFLSLIGLFVWWVSLGQPPFVWLLLVFCLSTFVVFRWWARGREYLLDKETDHYYRNGKLLCQLSEIDNVRVEEEWIWAGDDADLVTSAYVVFRDRKDNIPLELAHKIARYIGVDVSDDREHRPIW